MKKSTTIATVILTTSMLFCASAIAGGSKPAGPPAVASEVGASVTALSRNTDNIVIAGLKD